MSNHGTKIGMGRTQLANEDMLFFCPASLQKAFRE